MQKLTIDYSQYKGLVADICRQIVLENWQPDYIAGITRGGLLPAVMISQYLKVPMHSLNVSLRDNIDMMGPESNLWMAEDAFGYQMDRPKNILIVDDINDLGSTIKWIKQDWASGCLPNDPRWQDVWNKNVKFAVVVNNDASEVKEIDYIGMHINKQEKDVWVDFPYEEWWMK